MLTEVPRSPVYFCYARPRGFSGQREATELVLEGLRERGWDCRLLPLPVLARTGPRWSALLLYGLGLGLAWMRCLVLLAPGSGWLCLNAGQTPASFVRDLGPLLLGRLGLGRERVVVSLHGSLFMQWRPGSWRARAFRWLLARAGRVTVLGETQRRHLAALGVAADRVEVVINSCRLPPVSPAACEGKWRGVEAGVAPLRVLHLSSLIPSKGFPAFLEALARLAARDSLAVEAVLCGRVLADVQPGPFADAAAAEAWIDEMVARINSSRQVRVRWVKGAVGEEKARLFREAQVFVFPSRYAVEAQPLVLLEAMASGCAILSTAVGEIPSILHDRAAVFLDPGEPAEIAEHLVRLATEPGSGRALARSAHSRFLAEFSREAHVEAWERRLAGPAIELPPAGLAHES